MIFENSLSGIQLFRNLKRLKNKRIGYKLVKFVPQLIRMKKVIGLIIVALISYSAHSQDFDKRLLAKYTEEELSTLQKDNPVEFEFLNKCLDGAVYLADYSPKKGMNKEISGEIGLKDINAINFFELDIELIEDRYQYFKIKGHNKLLVIRAKAHIK